MDEALESFLHRWCRDLIRSELVLERDVSEAAGDDAAVRCLVPVVEAVAPVVRDLEQPLGHGLRRDHLPPRGDDQPFERTEKPAGISVRGDDDRLRPGLLEGRDARALADLDPGLRRARRKPSHEPRGLKNAVGRVEDRGRMAVRERRRQRIAPLDLEPVRTHRLVLLLELGALLLVHRQPKAADRPKRVSRQVGEVGKCPLGPAPQLARTVTADRLRQHRVRRRAAA